MRKELNEAPQRSADLEYGYTTVTLKQQGNGTDSWVINYFNDKDERVFSEIFYKDPTKPDTETTEKTIQGLSDGTLTELWVKMIDHMDKLPEDVLNQLAAKIPEKRQTNPQ